jgi:plastocyanin
VNDGLAVTVQAPLVLTSVVISGATTVTAGSTIQLTASPKDQNGNPIAGATLAWSSDATSKATVNATTGLVTGVAAGSANIRVDATLGSATAFAIQAITVAAGGGFPLTAAVATAGSSFNPPSVDIGNGGTINWSGLTGHNVMFTTAGSPPDITTGNTGSSTFSGAGTYYYYCSIHGSAGAPGGPNNGMAGAIVVHP